MSPDVAKVCCQQSHSTSYAAEPVMTAAAATAGGNIVFGFSAGELLMRAGFGFEHMPPYCCSASRQRVYFLPEEERAG